MAKTKSNARPEEVIINQGFTEEPAPSYKTYLETALSIESLTVRIDRLLTTSPDLVGKSMLLKYSHPVFEMSDINAISSTDNKITSCVAASN